MTCCNLETNDNKNLSPTFEINSYDITMDILPAEQQIKGFTTISASTHNKNDKLFSLLINDNLHINKVLVNNKPVTFNLIKSKQSNLSSLTITLPKNVMLKFIVAIDYQGTLNDTSTEGEQTQNLSPNNDDADIISAKGIFLSEASGWYPFFLNQLSYYKLTVTIPSEYRTITEGKLMQDKVHGKLRTTIYKSSQLLPSLTLTAGKYHVKTVFHKGIQISTFFSKENLPLADSYLDHSKQYIDLYEKLIAPYPYSKFYVVENFLQTGYGMPSYTLIGGKVIRLPFIVKTSLGHEILHNWLGNSLFLSPEGGNWCEGLTSYLADYYYIKEQSNQEAIIYRRNINKTFTQFVTKQNDFPLSQFTHRYDFASSAIGYGKCLMVFHQLNNLIGDKLFFSTLKSLYQAYQYQLLSWKNIQTHFEKTSQRDLSQFFQQWIQWKGAPEIHLKNVTLQKIKNKFVIQFTLFQTKPTYQLFIPVHIKTEHDLIIKRITFSDKEKTYSFHVDHPPKTIAIDPEYHIFRKLYPKEIPTSLSLIFNDQHEKALFTTNESTNKTSIKEIENMLHAKIWHNNLITTPYNNSIIFFGKPSSSLFNSLFNLPKQLSLQDNHFILNGKKYSDPDTTLVTVLKNKKSGKGILLIYPLNNKLPPLLLKKLPHYQNFSYLIFKKNKVIVKGEFNIDTLPLTYQFH